MLELSRLTGEQPYGKLECRWEDCIKTNLVRLGLTMYLINLRQ